MLHYNQQIARRQRQVREEALEQWRVEAPAQQATSENGGPATSSNTTGESTS